MTKKTYGLLPVLILAMILTLCMVFSASATDTYNRAARWVNTDTDAYNSGYNANDNGSTAPLGAAMWWYENIDSDYRTSCGLSDADPWYDDDIGTTPTVYWHTKNVWKTQVIGGVSNTFPIFANTRLNLQMNSVEMVNWKPRTVWTAPANGTVTTSGTLGLAIRDRGTTWAVGLEYAIAKRVGGASGTYTLLTSGAWQLPSYTNLGWIRLDPDIDLTAIPAMTDIAMNAGDQIIITIRGILLPGSITQWGYNMPQLYDDGVDYVFTWTTREENWYLFH